MSITQYMKTVKDADTSNNNNNNNKSSSNNNNNSDSKVAAASAAKNNDHNKSKKTKVVVFGSTRAIGKQLITTLSMNHTNWEIVAVVCRRGNNNNNNSLLSLFSTTSPTNNNIRIVQGDSTNKDDVLSLSQDADIVFSCTVRGDVFVTQPKTHSVASSRAACLWSWKRIAI